MIKIIAGRLKGRVIPTEKGANYRPTTSKVREAMFSILSSGEFDASSFLQNAVMLDLYAGTGSISFEAISRGVIHSTLVDIDDGSLQKAKEFAEKIGEASSISIFKCSATCLPKAYKKYNFVVMDPPYKKLYPAKTLQCLVQNNWLESGAIIAIETSLQEEITLPTNMELVMIKKYGNSKLSIIRYVES
ncbi:MAG: RsmD family RNA methyltransferase [Rickettsiaceae bacterium]|nr:RsmD family RNA methyltransferase [Rickettsiaceae bacterium]